MPSSIALIKKDLLKLLIALQRRLENYPLFYRYLFFQNPHPKNNKCVFIDLNANPFKRFLYGFIKFLSLSEYDIYINASTKLFYDIKTDKWSSPVFSERLVIIGKPKANTSFIHITTASLSADYFFDVHDKQQPSYHIPMMQHPLMYNKNWWNKQLENRKRKHSLFMAGNFDESIYQSFSEDKLFSILSRLEVYFFLNNKNFLYPISSFNELQTFTESKIDNKVILIERRKTDVPMNILRDVLNNFSFFFALPGIEIPYSHNVIEAMSCGCIPFIQKEYADYFQPKLKNGHNAIFFSGFDDIEQKICSLFKLASHEIDTMQKKVLEYYDEYLTPNKVVEALEKINFSNIYLQAEHESVKILKRRTQNE